MNRQYTYNYVANGHCALQSRFNKSPWYRPNAATHNMQWTSFDGDVKVTGHTFSMPRILLCHAVNFLHEISDIQFIGNLTAGRFVPGSASMDKKAQHFGIRQFGISYRMGMISRIRLYWKRAGWVCTLSMMVFGMTRQGHEPQHTALGVNTPSTRQTRRGHKYWWTVHPYFGLWSLNREYLIYGISCRSIVKETYYLFP